MKTLILLLALVSAPMAFCSDEASYQAIKYGDVITDAGDVISCDDLDEEAQDYDYEEYNCEE